MQSTLTAKQLTTGQKFGVRVVQQFGLRGFLGSVISSGISQWNNTPPEWGQGWDAYGARYGSAFGVTLSRQVFAFGLESALHEDPRYFPSSEKGFGPRIKNVLKQALISKKDDGSATFAYSRVISAFGAGQLANSWQPKSNNSVGDGLERGAYIMLGDAGWFAVQEFIPFTRNTIFRRHR
ncbi:MAG: hypothetical protein ACJ73N_15685 [Bryobacteraceae bacterium]